MGIGDGTGKQEVGNGSSLSADNNYIIIVSSSRCLKKTQR